MAAEQDKMTLLTKTINLDVWGYHPSIINSAVGSVIMSMCDEKTRLIIL